MKLITNRRNKNRLGASMTEYLIMLAIVAVGSIVIFTLFGSQIKAVTHRVIAAFGGTPAGAEQTTAVTTEGATESKTGRGMDKFDPKNSAESGGKN